MEKIISEKMESENEFLRQQVKSLLLMNSHEKFMKRQNYTRNEWRRCKTTLEMSGEDVKIYSKRVEKIQDRVNSRFFKK